MNDSPTTFGRLRSIDILRGLACVLMAVDHVRVYSGLPAGGPTAGIFFTRWVTHFVAPAFCFLAGTAAYFHGRKLGEARLLSRFLVQRGLLLVLLEATLIHWLWTFNLDHATDLLAGVIWMLGGCMVLLGAMTPLSTRAFTCFGLAVVFGQQLLGLAYQALPQTVQESTRWLFQFLYFGGFLSAGEQGPTLVVLYSIVPWIGVLALGYAFGALLLKDSATRRRWCLRIGLGSTAAFLFVGGALVLLQPSSPEAPPALFRLLGQQKYPASQLFLLMTLGPLVALVPWAEKARGWVADALELFGRVPLFYYLFHILLIHLAAMGVSLLRTGAVDPWLFANHPLLTPPPPGGYPWSLALLYLVFALVLPVLVLGCRWYAARKARRPGSWMRFF